MKLLHIAVILLLTFIIPSIAMAGPPVISNTNNIITATNLISNHTASASSATTASISPAANSLVLVTVANTIGSGTATLPTLSGAGGTWVQVNTAVSTTRRTTVFRDLESSWSGGALTISFGGTTQTKIDWAVDQYTGINTSGTNGSGAIVQSVPGTQTGTSTGASINLASFASSNNLAVSAFSYTAATLPTVGSGFNSLAALSDSTNAVAVATEYLQTWNHVGWTWTSASRTVTAVAMEIAASVPAAADLWVSKGGNDANPGTKAAPFLTMQAAANVVTPGSTIHVGPGIYGGTFAEIYQCQHGVFDAMGVDGPSLVCLTTSGVAGAPITFVSEPKWGAKLTCSNDTFGNYGSMFFTDASYTTFKNFESYCPLSTVGFFATWFGNNGHNQVIGNYIHNYNDDPVAATCLQTGILDGSDSTDLTYLNSGYNLYDGNIIHHFGPAAQCVTYHGFYLGSVYETAENNIVSGGAGFGIQSAGGGTCHEIFANNTVFDNTAGGFIIENTAGNGSGHADMCGNGGYTDYITVVDNIAVNNGWQSNGSPGQNGGISVFGTTPFNTGPNNIVTNNLAYGNGNYDIQTTSPTVFTNAISGSNSTVFKNYQTDKGWGTPLVSYNYLNYQPRGASPAINRGVSISTPNHDVINTVRPQCGAYDIGAFEAYCFGGRSWPGLQVNP